MIAATGVPHVQPSIERLTSCSAPAWTPASRSTSASITPCQTPVADEITADLVGDARQRDVPLDLFPGEQVVERQLELVIDHATDLEAP